MCIIYTKYNKLYLSALVHTLVNSYLVFVQSFFQQIIYSLIKYYQCKKMQFDVACDTFFEICDVSWEKMTFYQKNYILYNAMTH